MDAMGANPLLSPLPSGPWLTPPPTPSASIESLDYDINLSTIFEQDHYNTPSYLRRRHNVLRWVVCIGTGCTTGLLAFIIDVCTDHLVDWRWRIAALASDAANNTPVYTNQTLPLSNVLNPTPSYISSGFAATAVFAAIGAGLVAVSAALILWVEPVAGGSGMIASHPNPICPMLSQSSPNPTPLPSRSPLASPSQSLRLAPKAYPCANTSPRPSPRRC